MHTIRSYDPSDLPALIQLTIDTFRPFYEQTFRAMVGDAIFTHQHGNWADDYRAEVPTLHDPEHHSWVAVAELDGDIAGYVGWKYQPHRHHGDVHIVAVHDSHRRSGLGRALCEHAIADLKSRGADVATIGTGGDSFHAPARRLYESLGFTPIPVAVYFRQL